MRLTFLAAMGDSAFPVEAIAMLGVDTKTCCPGRILRWLAVQALRLVFNLCEVCSESSLFTPSQQYLHSPFITSEMSLW